MHYRKLVFCMSYKTKYLHDGASKPKSVKEDQRKNTRSGNLKICIEGECSCQNFVGLSISIF